ncbi:hypothetical protein C2E23DRAFT_907567 [Lenzites betulinus]|nr:hypothetical protein C2E23DRAFT_907567 [Lenzites betulinus]
MSTPPTVVFLAPQDAPDPEPAKKMPPKRELMPTELREKLTAKLRELTGNPHAQLRYAADAYARFIVIRHRYTLEGWPTDIPYLDFNTIPGSAPSLVTLLDMWDTGALRFEGAGEDVVAEAVHDPRSVFPGGTCSVKPAAEAEDDESQRKLSGPYLCPHWLPKEGIKSAAFMHEPTASCDAYAAQAAGGSAVAGGGSTSEHEDAVGAAPSLYLLPESPITEYNELAGECALTVFGT